MFERFSEAALKVIGFAREEAGRLGSYAIRSEHLLLGLCRQDEEMIRSFDFRLSEGSIRKQMESHASPRAASDAASDMSFDDDVMFILQYAFKEAEAGRNPHIRTEHLLAGILDEKRCLGAQILRSYGLSLEIVRGRIAQLGNSD